MEVVFRADLTVPIDTLFNCTFRQKMERGQSNIKFSGKPPTAPALSNLGDTAASDRATPG